MTDATGELAHWPPYLLEFEYCVGRRAGIKNQAADALLRIEKGGMNTIELDDDFPKTVVSLIYNRGKVRNDHDGNSELSRMRQQLANVVEKVDSALLEGAGIA